MASRIVIRTLRPTSALHSFKTCRTFITLPGAEPMTLKETRILPYKSTSLYKLIADVDSYSTFLPYCQESKVTKWSSEDENGNLWPAEADLRIGWGGYEETFSSRLFCIPNSVVEALGGESRSALSRTELKHHTSTLDSPRMANDVFKWITTRWVVKPLRGSPPSQQLQRNSDGHPTRDETEVNLTIEFQFANPVYAALSKAVAPKVAVVMIDAFEERARKLLDGPEGSAKN